MRSAEPRFDERQAGFRGLLDLLHQAQREGWLRLHRDRKGIWRIFATTAESSRPPVAPEAVPATPSEAFAEPFTETFPEAFPEPAVVPEAEAAPPETDVLWEAVESPDETIVFEPARGCATRRRTACRACGSGSREETAQSAWRETRPEKDSAQGGVATQAEGA